MANVIIINESTQAVDPDHISFIDIEKQEIRVDGHTIKLNSADFEQVLAAKEGKK